MAKVLLVENESIIAIHVRGLLEDKGHHVVGVAENGREAIEIAESELPDVVIMDIKLKEAAGGIEAAEVLRKSYGCQVIFMTGSPSLSMRRMMEQTGHSGILNKPFKSAELIALLEKALSEKKDG